MNDVFQFLTMQFFKDVSKKCKTSCKRCISRCPSHTPIYDSDLLLSTINLIFLVRLILPEFVGASKSFFYFFYPNQSKSVSKSFQQQRREILKQLAIIIANCIITLYIYLLHYCIIYLFIALLHFIFFHCIIAACNHYCKGILCLVNLNHYCNEATNLFLKKGFFLLVCPIFFSGLCYSIARNPLLRWGHQVTRYLNI